MNRQCKNCRARCTGAGKEGNANQCTFYTEQGSSLTYPWRPASSPPKVGEWIPCCEGMPENETEVEISCIRRYIGVGDKRKVACFTARAFYTDGTTNTEDSNFVWDDYDNWEYDEEKDAYIIQEGWWEYVTFSEQFGAVDAEVIAWKPLPEPYHPNTCKNTECPFYCPKQDCVAKEGCGGYTNE